MGYNITVSERLRRLNLYGFICLLISSIGCFFLGISFIVDAAGIELFGLNEPPYQWDFIYAGAYNLICSFIGLICARYSCSKAGLIVPIVGTFFMISGAMLEFILLEWGINVIIILFCTSYLIIAYRADYYNRVLRMKPHLVDRSIVE